MKRQNLIGLKFEKLTVISAAENLIPKNSKGRTHTAWLCKCDCGNILTIRTGTLLSGKQKSCGCILKSGRSLKENQTINKLTTIKYNGKSSWLCKCECGSYTTVNTHHIISGNTKSCGCLKIETTKQNRTLAMKVVTKYEPSIASSRRLWRSYCYQDKNCNLTYEEWFAASQSSCFYCGTLPYIQYNAFLKKKDASQFSKDNGFFTYNGLDRIDNSKYHTLDNIVSCCQVCNRAKGARSISDFYKYISNLKYNNVFHKPENLLALPTNYLLTSVSGAYRHYIRNYKQIEIDLETFYTLSQLPCHYCGLDSSNYFNVYLNDKRASQNAKDGAHYHYNGIDRLNNDLTHTIDNVVPCCKYCNFAKSKLTLSEFNEWIDRIQKYQIKKHGD